jgi:hypothetical protein
MAQTGTTRGLLFHHRRSTAEVTCYLDIGIHNSAIIKQDPDASTQP